MSVKAVAKNAVNSLGNLLLSPPYGGLGHFHNHGPRDRRRIALTFDDGPSKPSTQALLDVLGEQAAKATFFCIGLNVSWHPDVLARAFGEGHVIANHSMMHSRKAGLLPLGADHIDEASREITRVIGCRPRLYRPPWGWLTPWEARRVAARGYAVIGWDVYPDDWKLPEVAPEVLVEDVRRQVQPGSIVLFHDAMSNVIDCRKTNTSRAVARLVPLLRGEGYELVTVPELLGLSAYAPADAAGAAAAGAA